MTPLHPSVERVRAIRREQGLPEHLEDPTQIRRLAGLLTPPVAPAAAKRRKAAAA